MFKHAYQLLTALIFLAWLVVPATQAQSIILKADIPFDFVVGEKRFPSGEYHVKSLYQAATEIRGKDARSTAIILTTGIHAGKISDVGELVFNHYGDYYFLSRILAPSSDTGQQLTKSRLEREVAWRTSTGGITIIAAKSPAKKSLSGNE
jgi:hypothetical protein